MVLNPSLPGSGEFQELASDRTVVFQSEEVHKSTKYDAEKMRLHHDAIGFETLVWVFRLQVPTKKTTWWLSPELTKIR